MGLGADREAPSPGGGNGAPLLQALGGKGLHQALQAPHSSQASPAFQPTPGHSPQGISGACIWNSKPQSRLHLNSNVILGNPRQSAASDGREAQSPREATRAGPSLGPATAGHCEGWGPGLSGASGGRNAQS